jgi:hypothetical protein
LVLRVPGFEVGNHRRSPVQAGTRRQIAHSKKKIPAEGHRRARYWRFREKEFQPRMNTNIHEWRQGGRKQMITKIKKAIRVHS